MAPKKSKQQMNGRFSDHPIVQDGSGNVNGNENDTNDEDSAPRMQVLDTPFSIDMFQQTSKHPYDDLSLPPKPNTVVHIRPEAIWASLSKYNSFIIRNHKVAVHHYALVSRFQPLPKQHSPLDIDTEVCCPARILEIRALDTKNVYIRLYWLYTPDQLLRGRQPHHGKHELVITNHMEIVDAARVIEPLTVINLKEMEDWQGPFTGMYWRQTYHVLSKELSPPKTHCICNRPVCPDDILVRCNNSQCALLLHAKCIEDATLTKLRLQHQQQQDTLSTSQNGTAIDYVIQIIVSQREKHRGRKRVGCTDVLADRHWELDIECLGCGNRIQ
ncbi:MAG: hypothetical protein Q9226_000780 [Calogaya cf. arnoldii]